jgi:hypothetical protein
MPLVDEQLTMILEHPWLARFISFIGMMFYILMMPITLVVHGPKQVVANVSTCFMLTFGNHERYLERFR